MALEKNLFFYLTYPGLVAFEMPTNSKQLYTLKKNYDFKLKFVLNLFLKENSNDIIIKTDEIEKMKLTKLQGLTNEALSFYQGNHSF